MWPRQISDVEAAAAAQGEFRLYKVDHVLTENDIREHTRYNDLLVANDGFFCIHCAWAPGEGKYDFRLKDWIMDLRDQQPYGIPFRCLYSANIDNLLMAERGDKFGCELTTWTLVLWPISKTWSRSQSVFGHAWGT